MLFIFNDSLNKCIGDINDGDVSILKCVNHACEHYCFCQNCGGADISFCDVVWLRVSSNYLPGLDLTILLFLNKNMRFKDMLLLSFCQLMPMHGLVQVVPLELLHFNGDCLLCSLAPFFQGCLHGHLCHDHANNICASVQTLPHQLHLPLHLAQSVLSTL